MKKTVFASRRSRLGARIASLTLVWVLVCLCLAPGACAAAPSRADLVRFLPTTIDVSASGITLEGYFVNLNPDCKVSNFRDFHMDVTYKGELVVSGDFEALSAVTVEPLGVQAYTFRFSGAQSDMTYGSFVCSEAFSCPFSCTFTCSAA